ncbi:MAG: uracil-DNA glycosylase [Desulfobacteraceae bacterium]|nr:MAG: uracil-DNA glycosylase [Desulfobacteraceae bacterium]
MGREPERIDCHRCSHYFVTWQREHPHGCKRMGFKSALLPSAEVYRASGTACLAFEFKGGSTPGNADGKQ